MADNIRLDNLDKIIQPLESFNLNQPEQISNVQNNTATNFNNSASAPSTSYTRQNSNSNKQTNKPDNRNFDKFARNYNNNQYYNKPQYQQQRNNRNEYSNYRSQQYDSGQHYDNYNYNNSSRRYNNDNNDVNSYRNGYGNNYYNNNDQYYDNYNAGNSNNVNSYENNRPQRSQQNRNKKNVKKATNSSEYSSQNATNNDTNTIPSLDISSRNDNPRPSTYQKQKSQNNNTNKPKQTTSNQPNSNKTQEKSAKQQEPKKAKDLTRSEILIDQLKKNKCECMVCYQYIKHDQPIWSCGTCFHIFHLRCIKKWASSPSAKIEENSEKWRCPGCQTILDKVPTKYTCFCGKKINPDSSKDEPKPFHLKQQQIAHSCNEVCSKLLYLSTKFWTSTPNEQMDESLIECKHKCVQICHPGPCQPCESIVNRTCNCGKAKFQVKCSSTKIPACQSKCDKMLNCSLHECGVVCHMGECAPCNIDVEQRCYSHSETRTVKCGSKEFNESADKSFYKCETKCNRVLECGNHNCSESCHEGPCKPCSLLPSKLNKCPCGKTEMKMLLIKNKIIRTNCLDPVPTCEKVCAKVLHDLRVEDDEVHFCEQKCHTNECEPCAKLVEIKCRCGRESEFVECNKRDVLKLCKNKCQKKKSCKRHQCNEVCCNDAEHMCMTVCNRVLNCGMHKCEELCHKNPCQRCLVASFEERICYCGHTVQYPPIRCGTAPLECRQMCTRPHDCDHPVSHTCHWEEKCPNCPHLTSKMCMGEHELRHNIPCYMKDVSCGKPCSKPLPSCSHSCQKTCHKSVCVEDEESEICTQPCQKERPHCAHACGSPCHGNSPCPDTVCQAMVVVKCKCGLKSKQAKCGQKMYGTTQVIFENLASEIKEMLSCKSIDLSSFNNTQILKKIHELPCDEECFIAERNKNLAQALQIDASAKPKPIYSEYLKSYAREEPAFVLDTESKFESFVKEVKLLAKTNKKYFNMPIMKTQERKFIHELAGYYGFETQSVDPEPFRNVNILAIKEKCYLPSLTLSQSVDYKNKQSTMPRLANLKQFNQSAATKPIQSNLKKLSNSNPTSFDSFSQRFSILPDEDDGSGENSDFFTKLETASTTNTPTNAEKETKIIDYFDLTD